MSAGKGKKQYIGLTGGIGAGKSTVSARFAALGAVVLDADALSRAALLPDGACYAAVVAAFGCGIVQADGSLNRAAIARTVFSDPAARETLEGIVHPHVLKTMFAQAEETLRTAPDALLVFDVPLLIECGLNLRMDYSIAVVADEAVRIERIRRRSGLTEAQARARIASQIPEREMRARVDLVIDNNGGLPSLYAQVDAAYRGLKGGCM